MRQIVQVWFSASRDIGLQWGGSRSDHISLMHYFLGLEVWQEQGHIFLGQGRYTVDILSHFQMGDYRPMSTPMITNWKKLHASETELVDPTLYR